MRDGDVSKTATTKVAVAPVGGKIVPVEPPATTSGVLSISTDGSNVGSQRYHPGRVDIFFLGITIVMCGQYMSWNIVLSAGVGSTLIGYTVMGFAYITFCCCVAEVTSALPFAGGSYGLARCTLGFFPAFLIGCAESLEYIASIAVEAMCVANIIIQAAPSLAPYKPLLWLVVFYIPSTAIQCLGGAPFWVVSTVLGSFQCVLLLVYCFGMVGHADFRGNASNGLNLFAGDVTGMMQVFPFMSWFFLGIEALNLASNDVRSPKRQIPVAQVACMCALFVTGVYMLLTTVSLPVDGGIPFLNGALAPLDVGFSRLFGIDAQLVTLLSLPAQYAGAYGFSWASAKLIHAMGASRLLPSWLASTSTTNGTPYAAILTVSLLSYAICLFLDYVPAATSYLLPLCLLFAFTSYTGQCVGYISLKKHYPIMKQSAFKNPFGIAGATYSLAVWAVGIVGIVGFQGHGAVELALFAGLFLVLGVYYLLVAKRRQIMSEEESKVLLVAHITRFNEKKNQRLYAPGAKSSDTTSGRRRRLQFLFGSQVSKYHETSTKVTMAERGHVFTSHGQ